MRKQRGQDTRAAHIAASALKFVSALCGVGLLLWMLQQVGWNAMLKALRPVGLGGFLVIVALFAAAQVPACLGWLWVMGSSRDRVTVSALYGPYAVGDALNHSIPSADTVGEMAKVWWLRDRMPWEHAAASVTLHKVLELIALSLLMSTGLIVSWIRVELPLWWYLVGAGVTAGMLVLVAGFYRGQRTGIYGPLFQRFLARFHGSARSGEVIDREMQSTLARRHVVPLATSVVLASWAAGILEAYLCLRWLGFSVRWDLALTVESFGLFITHVAFFVPGRIGVAEGGRVLLLTTLGVSLPQALAFAVVRRLREIVWIAVGFAFLFLHRRQPVGHERTLGRFVAQGRVVLGQMNGVDE